jgi:phosphoribosylanthranilate isomerase
VTGSIRIKICGITHPDDAQAAVDAGADLIGLNFVPGSPRALDLRTAESITERVAGQVERVAVFQDAEDAEITRVTRRIELERLQFHGDETEEQCEAVDLPVIKALRGADVDAAEEFPATVLLLDHPSKGGGSGVAWDWSDAGKLIERGFDVVLAGGLTADNVGEAISGVGDIFPWGVDVTSGVETDGTRKSAEAIQAFIAAVRKSETEE